MKRNRDHFGVGIMSGSIWGSFRGMYRSCPSILSSPDHLLRGPRKLFFIVSLLSNGHFFKMYHTNAINTLCMAFSGLSPASFRLAKQELETPVCRVMDISSFCHHRVLFVDKLLGLLDLYLTVNLSLAVSLPFPQG